MNIIRTLAILDPSFAVAVVFALIIIFLASYLVNKMRATAILKKSIVSLNQTIEELDSQAKLIIKGDMELKLYQEEVEDKLNKLTLLKNLILSSLHILDQEKLFYQIDEKTINDLGFKRGLILHFADYAPKVNIGFTGQEIEALQSFLQHRKAILLAAPLLSAESEICKELIPLLQSRDFLIAPIKARDKAQAIFILSNLVIPTDVKRAEKEIFSIICMYLSQCLDNIQLFEDIYNVKDELEKKVKERTNELVRSLREIETINKAKSDFVSDVSHELRTPLTSIKGFSSLLVAEKFGKLPEEAKKRLEKIDENVNKLVDMVNTLLDISRIESGKMEIKIAPSDIVKVIKEVGDFLSVQMQANGLKLVLEVPEALTVYMDKGLIERVLINLINNAVKFTPKGGTISLRCTSNSGQVVVAVADTGYGIAKENLDKIFQEFFRINNAAHAEVKGTGLGLSLVKKIIETHKEKLWVESEPNKGSTFYFTLKASKHV
ncbi:MAG: HAMP domain-containing sensor histidine kinase [Candidatus Omnitrophota bacterium]